MTDKEKNIGDIMNDFFKAGEESIIKDAEEKSSASSGSKEEEKNETELESPSERGEKKEDLSEKEEEKKEGVSPVEEKFKELEQRLQQRTKEKDALLQKVKEFKIAVLNSLIRYKNIQNIFNTDIDPVVHTGEKNHLISLFRNADMALNHKDLNGFNNFLEKIEFEIDAILKNIEEEKQAKEAGKEIHGEAEKLPQEERQGFFKKLANAGWFLKEQKAKAMKLVLSDAAESLILLSRTRRLKRNVETHTQILSNKIKELKKEGKTEKEIDEYLKADFEDRERKHYNQHILEIKQKEAGKIYRFLNAYSKNVYGKEEKLANKKRKQAKMGALQKASGLGQLFGNTARAGRMIYDTAHGFLPLWTNAVTASTLFLGRFAEASKEARLMNTEVKSRTRIGGEEAIKNKDASGQPIDEEYLKAYEEALAIQEEAKKTGKVDANGNLKLSEEMYENAYKKFVNFDVLKRVGAYDEIVEDFVEDTQIDFETETDSSKKVNLQARIQFLKTIESSEITDKTQLDILLSKAFLDNVITEKEKAFLSQAYDSYNKCALNTRGFIQKSAAWSIKKQSLTLHKRIVNIDLDKKLTAEQKKLKQDFYFQMFESYLKDIDRMVDQAGMVDLLSYTARLTEKTAKAVSIAMIINTVWKLWEGGLDIVSGKKIISAPGEKAPARIPEERGGEGETGGWKEIIKERVIGKETKKEEESPAAAPRGQRWRDWIPGLGVEEKTEVPSETRPQTAPKAPSAPEEPSLEIEQEETPEGTQSPEIDELDKEILGKQEKIQENNNFLARVISPSSAEAAEQFKTFKESFNFLKGEEKENFKKIYLELKKSSIAEKINKNAGGGEKGKEAVLAEVFKKMKERGLLTRETQSVLPAKISEIKGEIWTRDKADDYFETLFKGWGQNKDKNEDANKLFLMFKSPKNKETYLGILTGKHTYNGKTGFQAADNWMSDSKNKLRFPEAEEPAAREEESKAETPSEKRERLEKEGRLDELAGKPGEKLPKQERERDTPSLSQEEPRAPERRRIETPRPEARPAIPAPARHTAIIEKSGSLWDAVKAMNLRDKTFNKAWADAKIYLDGEETDYKAHEVGLVDPKTKVIYNEKTNTIHIIPPEGGVVGTNVALNEQFQKKGVETPKWLKKELGMEIEKEEEPILLPKEKKPLTLPEGEEKEELPGKTPEELKEKESAEIISELSEKTKFSKEDINSIAVSLKVKPEVFVNSNFLDAVKSDEGAFKTKGAWDAGKLEFFYNIDITLEKAKPFFENTDILNKNLGLNLKPRDIYSRFFGYDIKILDDPSGERAVIKIKKGEEQYDFYLRGDRAEIKNNVSPFSEENISVKIDPKNISAEYLDVIQDKIQVKKDRSRALFKFIEKDQLEIDSKDMRGWFVNILQNTDLKTILNENWPRRFKSGYIFESKEEKSAKKLREFFVDYLTENKAIQLEENDYEKTCAEILEKYAEDLTSKKEEK